MKTRNIHFRFYHNGNTSKGGGTCVIREIKPGLLGVKTSLCSTKDNFCRRSGYDEALRHTEKVMNVGALPSFLNSVWLDVQRAFHVPRSRRTNGDYQFATKYWEKKKEEANA